MYRLPPIFLGVVQFLTTHFIPELKKMYFSKAIMTVFTYGKEKYIFSWKYKILHDFKTIHNISKKYFHPIMR